MANKTVYIICSFGEGGPAIDMVTDNQDLANKIIEIINSMTSSRTYVLFEKPVL